MLFAFANWEANPKNWDSFARVMMALFSVVTLGFGYGIGSGNEL